MRHECKEFRAVGEQERVGIVGLEQQRICEQRRLAERCISGQLVGQCISGQLELVLRSIVGLVRDGIEELVLSSIEEQGQQRICEQQRLAGRCISGQRLLVEQS